MKSRSKHDRLILIIEKTPLIQFLSFEETVRLKFLGKAFSVSAECALYAENLWMFRPQNQSRKEGAKGVKRVSSQGGFRRIYWEWG